MFNKEEWDNWFSMPQGKEFINLLKKMMNYETLASCSSYETYLVKDGFLKGIGSVLDNIEFLRKGE